MHRTILCDRNALELRRVALARALQGSDTHREDARAAGRKWHAGPVKEPMSEASRYCAEETLRDGTTMRIRAIGRDDKARLQKHFESLSERSVYHRFFGHKRSLNESDLRQLTELDFINHVGLAATLVNEGVERFIGVGRYLRSGDSPAEVAFAVLDEYQGRGIGTVLLHHLARIARQNGIRRFAAFVMGDNTQMLEVFANSGYRARDSYEGGTVKVSLELDPGDEPVKR